MKKNINYKSFEKIKSSRDNNIEIDKFKTTNVNVLLNRVRLDQRRTLKKRIVFSIMLAVLVSSLAVYFTI